MKSLEDWPFVLDAFLRIISETNHFVMHIHLCAHNFGVPHSKTLPSIFAHCPVVDYRYVCIISRAHLRLFQFFRAHCLCFVLYLIINILCFDSNIASFKAAELYMTSDQPSFGRVQHHWSERWSGRSKADTL